MLALFTFQAIQAAHIIGGEITYKCLGNGNAPNTRRYQFTMKIYRDCQGGGAVFDSSPGSPFNATVTIHRAGLNLPFRVFELGAPSITRIQPVANPCLIVPPNVCVEEGIYVMPIIELPVSTESYYVVYQRCCRNVSINNIVAPDQSGATYFVELTPEAQNSCNNSPTFNDFPPIVICAGAPFLFDHSATDAEGDQLVYELCSPFLGGGPNTFNAEASDGVAPNPDIAPPYLPVRFLLPSYSVSSPLGAAANLQLDANTGIMTAHPSITGQFVVGVCVSEYRNGRLLGTVRRDFQFNVATCEPTVVARMDADSMLSDKEFLILSCGDKNVNITNSSYQRQFINAYNWEFDINGDTTSLTTWDAALMFPDLGEYRGRLILNPNTSCGDTAQVVIRIFPEIKADFSYSYDTCEVEAVKFQDLSVTGSDRLTNWQWNFEGEMTSSVQHPSYFFPTAGDKAVRLQVRDVNGCVAQTAKTVRYFPVPPALIVAPNTFDGCVPASIFFNNLSDPINEQYDILWDFGDGGSSTDLSPTHIYETPGLYTISLDIISPLGCQIDTIFTNWINVDPSPTAAFTYSPQELTILSPTATFQNQSLFAVGYAWDFGGFGVSSLADPVFTFPDTGRHVVQLIATHESGCKDTVLQVIDIIPEIRYFLPNAFTPDSDGRNDTFKGTGVLDGMRNFSFNIWNRYGELLFTANDPEVGWDGQDAKTGKNAPPGVYVYTVQFIGPRGEFVERKGTLTLLR